MLYRMISAIGLAVALGVTGSAIGQEVASPPGESAPRVSPVDTVGKVGSHASMAQGSDGLPVVAYFDESHRSLKVARCNDSLCSGGNETLSTVDQSGAVGSYTSITIGSDGLPVISYHDSGRGDLKVAKCNDAACAEGDETLSTLDSRGIVGLFTAIAIGADGLPVISYFDRDNCDLKVAKCNDPACSGGDETLSTVDEEGCVGLFSTIVLPPDGLPLILYYSSSEGELKAAKCNDIACSGGDETISVVDSEESRGSFPAVAIDDRGLPMIVYYNHAHGDLMLARCNDSACAGGDESISVVDSSGLVGSHAALVLSDSGNPVIAYYDLAENQLKLLRCNDSACSGLDEMPTVLDRTESMKSYSAILVSQAGPPIVAYFDETNGDLNVVEAPEL